ncbi:MAG TPA: sulfate ABC transporter substrate-binding protein [Blastocatellia bacterium]|nr:sulfate ABC transporter substrate-binding protein [Blastocatellia bacterium]
MRHKAKLILKTVTLLSLGSSLFLIAALQACQTSHGSRRLILAGYTAPREAYGKGIIPAFEDYWRQKTGQSIEVLESYQASGAQSRAIVGGFEADVAALSLEGDIDRIAAAGLITHDWKAKKNRGIVCTSIVVIAVRKGNPLGIRDWSDLTKPGLNVLTPDPRTSGGAQWNINAIYGAALRGYAGVAKGDQDAAQGLLTDIFRNVSIMDKGGRESITNFEAGTGNAAITYENEVVVARQAGQTYDYVVPRSTILIENPAAVIDKNIDKHGCRDVAEAFVDFLSSHEAQAAFAKYGLRPTDKSVAEESKSQFPKVEDLWTIEFLGGWKQVAQSIFGPQGAYTKATEQGK